jgi:hypothetical protein
MSPKQFFIQLSIVSLFTAVGLYFLNGIEKLQGHDALSWGSLLLFIGLSLAMFFIGRRAAQSNNKNDFTNTVLGFTVGKLFLAMIVLFSYMQLAEPETRFFILPFFCVYFIYTIFETYFMMRLGRSNGNA